MKTYEQIHAYLTISVKTLAPDCDPGVMLAALENIALQTRYAYLSQLSGKRVQTAEGKPVPSNRKKGGAS